MIDALRQKEDALAAQIETFDADIAETIAKVDRLWSTRAREQGRSRLDSPTPSVNDACSSTRSYGELSLGLHTCSSRMSTYGAQEKISTSYGLRLSTPKSELEEFGRSTCPRVRFRSFCIRISPHLTATSTEVSRPKFAQCEDSMSLSRAWIMPGRQELYDRGGILDGSQCWNTLGEDLCAAQAPARGMCFEIDVYSQTCDSEICGGRPGTEYPVHSIL